MLEISLGKFRNSWRLRKRENEYVQQKLKRQEIKSTLNAIQEIGDDTIDTLMEFLLEKFKPEGVQSGIPSMHDLSREDLGRVKVMISTIDQFDVNSIVKLVKKRKSAADRTMEINRILKSAMADEDAGKFAEKENVLLKKREVLLSRIHEAEMRLTAMKEEMEAVEQQRDRAFQRIKDNAQNKHVFELSAGLFIKMSSIAIPIYCI